MKKIGENPAALNFDGKLGNPSKEKGGSRGAGEVGNSGRLKNVVNSFFELRATFRIYKYRGIIIHECALHKQPSR